MSRLLLTLFLFAIALLSKPATAEDWSRFRGPDGSGATSATGLALTWDDGKNIRWQAKLPGRPRQQETRRTGRPEAPRGLLRCRERQAALGQVLRLR